MRDRVARLRGWLAGGVFLLLAVIAAFLGYARYGSRMRHMALPLPLGSNIVREAGGWTYSRADGSKTLYTIHAAKFEQGKNGKLALHDVSLVLYGKKDDRRDRVYGEEFEYDQKAGVLRALGKVHIDLEGAAGERFAEAKGAVSTGRQPKDQSVAANVMHVTTSGLVYLEKLGVAATSDDVDVETGQIKGHARGADYSSDSGILMLHSAVNVQGSVGGRPVRVTAVQAQFDQRQQEALLTDATYESDGRKISADHAVLHRRPDGTLDRVDANGNVLLAAADGTVGGRRAELRMNAAGQPASAVLAGEVFYQSDDAVRQLHGSAAEFRTTFASGPTIQPDHAWMTGAVHLVERTRPSESAKAWNSRDLTAGRVELWTAPGAKGSTRIRNATAAGNAKLVMVDFPQGPKQSAATQTEIAADELAATMSQSGPATLLDEVNGRGHTSLLQVSSEGVEQTSEGDSLQARFGAEKTIRGGRKANPGLSSQALVSATQEGHVSMTRHVPTRAKAAAARETVQRAIADRASYDGAKDQMLLSGNVRLGDADGTMWSQQVIVDRATGDAHATGSIKIDYTQNAGGEPMHVLADRADLSNSRSISRFFGKPVRVWQGGNQMFAPELEVDRAAKRMIASGGPSNGAGAVQTILMNAVDHPGNKQSGEKAEPARCGTAISAAGSGGQSISSAGGAMRIVSGSVVYSGTLHQVDFSGGVRADTADATVRAAQATAFLTPQGGSKSVSMASFESGLSRIVATGHVELARAGTRASGEQLVYEPAPRTFLLSGSIREPARAVDTHGTSTAAAFRFTGCDDTLEASGVASGARQRVETDAPAAAGKRAGR